MNPVRARFAVWWHGRARGARRRGMVLAAVLVLAVAGAGYQAAVWPDVQALATRNPGTTAFIGRHEARRRAAGEPVVVRLDWVRYGDISPHVVRAVVAAEDMEFFFHDGFSTAEMRAALRQAVREGRLPRGASTITQQLAKNLWLSPSRWPWRKLKEAVLTWQLERRLGKERILELYLNVVEFGPGVYGVGNAARRYFGTGAAWLTESQAAQLAGGLPRSTWYPGRDSPSYLAYVANIRSRMDRASFLWSYVGGPPPAVAPGESIPPLVELLNLDSILAVFDSLEPDTLGDSLGADTARADTMPADTLRPDSLRRDALPRDSIPRDTTKRDTLRSAAPPVTPPPPPPPPPPAPVPSATAAGRSRRRAD